MNHVYYILSATVLLFGLNACKPPHHPRNPNYGIIKPKIKYAPTQKNLDKMVKELQGKPYVWAEEGPNNFDCSGFTYYMYGSMGIEIPRVAREQAKQGRQINVNELIYGDLIFFDTERRHRGRITHVGMYLGNGWFTHASTTEYEIVYSNLNTSSYYKKRLRICRRYLPKKNTLLREEPVQKTFKPWERKEPTSIPKSPHISTIGNFYIQVGSFTDKPHHDLLYKITKLGYHYKLIQFPIQGKNISKLLIGPYSSKSDAHAVLRNVKQQIQKSAFIAEIR